MKCIFLIVLDSVGIGATEDAKEYGEPLLLPHPTPFCHATGDRTGTVSDR